MITECRRRCLLLLLLLLLFLFLLFLILLILLILVFVFLLFLLLLVGFGSRSSILIVLLSLLRAVLALHALCQLVDDKCVCISLQQRNNTHFGVGINQRLRTTSLAVVVEILAVLEREHRFGKFAHGAEHVLVDELVQNLHQVGIGMISVHRRFVFF